MTKTPTNPEVQPKKPAAEAAARSFRVVSHVKVDGRRCGPGDTVVLSEADAERMLRSGSVQPLEA